MVFGTQMQATARALEPSRVLRIEPRAVSRAGRRLARVCQARSARWRSSGSAACRAIAAEPPKPQATVVGNRWDPASHDLKRFLSRNQILFDWRDARRARPRRRKWGAPPGRRRAARRCASPTAPRSSAPTPASSPRALGLGTAPGRREYDTVIIGGGPAGLAAAVYGASEGLRTLVVECEAPGGQAETSSRIENYLGFPSGISGDELASRALRQARRLGAEILITRKTLRHRSRRPAPSHLDGGEAIRARTIILATGVNWRRRRRSRASTG